MARSWRWFRSKVEAVVTTPPDYIQIGSPFDRIKVVPVYRTRTQLAMHGLPDLALEPSQ